MFIRMSDCIAGSEAAAVEKALRSYVESKSSYGSDAKRKRLLAKVFQDFDQDGSGYLDLEEFEAAMVRMNFVGCQDAIADLFDKYDEDMSGYISYQEFVTNVLDQPNIPKNRLKRTDEGFIVKEFRARILEKNGAHLGFRGVRRILKRLDENGNGALSEQELQQGLVTYGISSTPHETASLMRYMDKDKNGRISIEEFFKALQRPMTRMRKILVRHSTYNSTPTLRILHVWEIYKVKKAWNGFLKKLNLGEGEPITLADLSKFYDCSKNPLVIERQLTEEEALRAFVRAWDKDHDDKITFQEFLEYYKDVSAGIEDDDYFELMVSLSPVLKQ